MAREQWLLGFHVLGAMLFIGGAVATGILHALAMRRSEPSEVAELLRMSRVGVVAVGLGALLAIAFGLWLVDDFGLDYGAGWLSAAYALIGISAGLGAVGGRRARHARYLAERLAASGQGSSPELRAALADRAGLMINYASFLAALTVLALMVWKP